MLFFDELSYFTRNENETTVHDDEFNDHFTKKFNDESVI